MDKKSIKKYLQYKVRQSWLGYPVPIPKTTIRHLEINLYQEFQTLSEEDQKKYLFSDELVRVLTFKYLDTMYVDLDITNKQSN